MPTAKPCWLTLVLVSCLALGAACRSGDSAARGALPSDAPARARSYRVPDVTLHTVELGTGRGPLRLVIHGGPGLDHTYLRPWLDPLSQGARLVYVDLRGHGRSSAPPDAHGYTIAAAAADLSALIEELSPGSPADLIAHDFGAEIALELAVRYPERVRRLVLVDPLWAAEQVRAVGRLGREYLGEAGWRRVQDLSTPQGTLRDPRMVTELFRRLGPMWWHAPPSEAVLARMGRDMLYRGDTDEHYLAEAAVWDGRRRVPEVRAAAFVISGASDHTFPAENSRELAERLPHGRYEEIPAAGHLPFIEQPARFLALVRAFLRDEEG